MYFVVKDGLNYSDTKVQNLICGGQYCNSDSVSTQIFTASKQSNRYNATFAKVSRMNNLLHLFRILYQNASSFLELI